MSQSVESFGDLLRQTRRSAVHLEMRDSYAVAGEADDFEQWQRTGIANTDPAAPYWAAWVELVADAVARGVVMRRARIVSEPVSDYIRFEHAGTAVVVAAGEQVRWLPRRSASDIALPGNDFWLFDDRLVQFNVFAGDSRWVHTDFTEDPAVVKLCSAAFETVWERGVPHEHYTL
ncbi:DUF6879 family protein [Kitasatospora sp. NPDC085879]|uniref:DUF6879 family protein n=1 Tax=Kitasatospora sp. NPDC085879 TaxID=3154769 RepID=UPI000BB0E15C|nr:DUF6879 family protein [Streptomyces sp. TLI_235]PBC69835.1 hypothetical protein BX265_7193 [Streptomyces sp. TLI_235]